MVSILVHQIQTLGTVESHFNHSENEWTDVSQLKGRISSVRSTSVLSVNPSHILKEGKVFAGFDSFTLGILLQIPVLHFYTLSPGIIKLFSWIKQSQTVWRIVALHANFNNVPPQTALLIWAVRGWWHQAAISLSVCSLCLLGLCSDCTTQESLVWSCLRILLALLFSGFNTPDHLRFLHFTLVSASRGLQHHVLNLKINFNNTFWPVDQRGTHHQGLLGLQRGP